MHKGLKIVGGSLLAAWLTLSPTHALAQEKNEGPVSIPQTTPNVERQMSAVEKAHEMRLFSENNPSGVGLFINLAKNPEIPPEVLIPAMTNALSQMTKGKADIQVQTNISEGNATKIITFVGGLALPSFHLGTMKSGFKQTADAFEVQQAKHEAERAKNATSSQLPSIK